MDTKHMDPLKRVSRGKQYVITAVLRKAAVVSKPHSPLSSWFVPQTLVSRVGVVLHSFNHLAIRCRKNSRPTAVTADDPLKSETAYQELIFPYYFVFIFVCMCKRFEGMGTSSSKSRAQVRNAQEQHPIEPPSPVQIAHWKSSFLPWLLASVLEY
jgi:hypothetical protein